MGHSLQRRSHQDCKSGEPRIFADLQPRSSSSAGPDSLLPEQRYHCFRWLAPRLVEALDEVPRAAVAGGMLLNVDGTIQDAGWRILGDGWGCPIGRGSDPRNGSYTYRRFVDCVGGACFVVPRTFGRS